MKHPIAHGLFSALAIYLITGPDPTAATFGLAMALVQLVWAIKQIWTYLHAA